MSMDKAIEHGKEHRKPWRGSAKSKNIDHTCRNHGSCDYCKFNRLHTFMKNKAVADYKLKEWRDTMTEREERKFLVQAIGEDYKRVELMSEAELIKFIDFQDIYGESFYIYEVTEFGHIEELHYVGWQPNCLIQLKNDKNEIVVSGYGTDH